MRRLRPNITGNAAATDALARLPLGSLDQPSDHNRYGAPKESGRQPVPTSDSRRIAGDLPVHCILNSCGARDGLDQGSVPPAFAATVPNCVLTDDVADALEDVPPTGPRDLEVPADDPRGPRHANSKQLKAPRLGLVLGVRSDPKGRTFTAAPSREPLHAHSMCSREVCRLELTLDPHIGIHDPSDLELDHVTGELPDRLLKESLERVRVLESELSPRLQSDVHPSPIRVVVDDRKRVPNPRHTAPDPSHGCEATQSRRGPDGHSGGVPVTPPLALLALTAAAVLAVWTVADPGRAVDGRGVLALALALAVVLAPGRRAVR